MTEHRGSPGRRVASALLLPAAVIVTGTGVLVTTVVLRAYAVRWGVIAPPADEGSDLDFANRGPLLAACATIALGGALAVLGSWLSPHRHRFWVMLALGTGVLLAWQLLLVALRAPEWTFGLSWLALSIVWAALALRTRDA